MCDVPIVGGTMLGGPTRSRGRPVWDDGDMLRVTLGLILAHLLILALDSSAVPLLPPSK